MTGQPHPRITSTLTIPADVNPATLAAALLVLAEGLELKAAAVNEGGASNQAAG